MRDNPIQFAVVREDPLVELGAVADGVPERVLLVGSGGCTALALQGAWPDAAFTLVDPNPAQLELVRRKVEALERGASPAAFNVEDDSPGGLSECGNFESLFRMLRAFLHELVATPEEVRAWFSEGAGGRQERVRRALASPYWRVAFELWFSDGMLEAMFGAAATQHAGPGSYPDYFRERLEAGLLRADAPSNPFLHHVFLGHYLAGALPLFLERPPATCRFEYRAASLDAVPDLEAYDLVDLSNVMDWMDGRECEALVRSVCERTRPGASVVWRQLNDDRDLASAFRPVFAFDAARDAERAAAERSLFYSSVHVGTKEEPR